MIANLVTSLVRRLSSHLARRAAQRDLDDLLRKLPSMIDGRLHPESELPQGWRLTLLRAVEPVDFTESGVRFRADITEAARLLGFLIE